MDADKIWQVHNSTYKLKKKEFSHVFPFCNQKTIIPTLELYPQTSTSWWCIFFMFNLIWNYDPGQQEIVVFFDHLNSPARNDGFRLQKTKRDATSHMLHVWYIYLQNWVIFGANVGKYSSTMEHMGYLNSQVPHIIPLSQDRVAHQPVLRG